MKEKIVFRQDEVTCNERGDEQAVEDAAKADNASAGMDEIEKDTRKMARKLQSLMTHRARRMMRLHVQRNLKRQRTVTYLYAEYDNYRKRTKEKDNLYSDAVARLQVSFSGNR